MSLNRLQLYTEKRDHLAHPIPYTIKIKPIGRTLTELEWQKFCKRYITPQLAPACQRHGDGIVYFIGENGIIAAEIFQQKFNHRFRMRLICHKKSDAEIGLQLANHGGLKIQEVLFRTAFGNKVLLNDEAAIISHFSPTTVNRKAQNL